MFKKTWDWRVLILAFEITFIFCFFLSIFQNSKLNIEQFDTKHWFYINRGLPVPFAGVSVSTRVVDFPIVKAPFIKENDPFYGGEEFNKVINLRVFLPLFFIFLAITYIFVPTFVKACDENENLNNLLMPLYFALYLGGIFGCIFVYFFWFPRI